MMSEELDILKILKANPSISQRKIAEQTGISLGQVNFLIKKCVRKGLIKIEGQTTKSLKYNLTPKGMAEKATLTLEYVKISYSAVIALTGKIRDLAEEYENRGIKVFIFGAQEEMMEICRISLAERAFYIDESKANHKFDPNGIYFYWDDINKERLEEKGLKVVNVLE